MNSIKANVVVDAKGLSCPMPIVKTKKAMNDLEAGLVLEIQATDKGSKADIKAWSESTGHQYLGTVEEENVLKHYIRKASNDDMLEKNHPNVINNDELEIKLKDNDKIVVLDVRETAEFAFNHIPEAISIPLGDLEGRMGELNKDNEIYVICRTGNRSDLAAQKLDENGFSKVFNVVPGMSQWTGKTTGLNK
ncbi:Rhodanese-related sulfurtransferase [Schinkia azotoformans MEV2011]|uniref:Rhodanese-related sulfurtransferase n=1 Tax=Schinkia azotoformans MEV2011 TaxID=1348973 RepID=A0A072NIB1_SCHAZ|nr:sulfurtransferase TusA family protein [Schinkia azotoformans]KEF37449.1 Rhodanese-related sulfurtransferase [Schinkia azotoformans MEV2011]MEC1697721.1 sulfurtransferase TusA family protein [Schinkia azotoformans]MEC1715909.1 sulfurtransferase TusA family protein [Schinkia azotoformans]MEC1726188.1 sulfurtransferase TusA family protein [Schinkia azotoformans]MEC1741548.1 sulfurtransferase TusA family protein [Schinkia azotoformans]